MEYGQFCPIAKSSEVLGEKWTILIIRELLMGCTRFNELQRGLGLISPTLLTKRLVMLEERGLVYRRRISGQRGFEYHPTESYKELLPILLSLGEWGMETVIRFQFSDLTDVPNWWIVVSDGLVDVCTSDPGQDVDIYFNTTVRTMTELWMGQISYRNAINAEDLVVSGPRALTRNIPDWMKNSIFADMPPAREIIGDPAAVQAAP